MTASRGERVTFGGTADGRDRDHRLARLLSELELESRIDVLSAAARFGVAPETIRRDLRALERRGKLQRVHGGAVPVQPRSRAEPAQTDDDDLDFGSRLWERLPRTGTLLIGAGHAGLCLAKAISVDPPVATGLIIVTRALDTAVVLSRVRTTAVYNLGGTVVPAGRAQEGDWPISELQRFRLDLAVISPDGIDVLGGLSQHTPAAAGVAQAEVAAAERVLVIGDRHSVGRRAFMRFAELTAADELVVPRGLDVRGLEGIDELSTAVTEL